MKRLKNRTNKEKKNDIIDRMQKENRAYIYSEMTKEREDYERTASHNVSIIKNKATFSRNTFYKRTLNKIIIEP